MTSEQTNGEEKGLKRQFWPFLRSFFSAWSKAQLLSSFCDTLPTIMLQNGGLQDNQREE